MSFIEQFTEELRCEITKSVDEFAYTGYEKNTPESLEFILLYKPLLKVMYTLMPEGNEWEKKKDEIKTYLKKQKIEGREGEIINKKLAPLRIRIKNDFGKITEQDMVDLIYSKEMSDAINFVYDTIRYRNKEPPLDDNYVWFE